MCYFKSPFDTVYERGDSVALAVMSANISFPENAPYNEVIDYSINLLNFILFLYFLLRFLQDMQNLILSMLKVNPMERPYIYSVIENTHDVIRKLEGRV